LHTWDVWLIAIAGCVIVALIFIAGYAFCGFFNFPCSDCLGGLFYFNVTILTPKIVFIYVVESLLFVVLSVRVESVSFVSIELESFIFFGKNRKVVEN